MPSKPGTQSESSRPRQGRLRDQFENEAWGKASSLKREKQLVRELAFILARIVRVSIPPVRQGKVIAAHHSSGSPPKPIEHRNAIAQISAYVVTVEAKANNAWTLQPSNVCTIQSA